MSPLSVTLASLAHLPRWVAWQQEQRPGRPRPTKIPYGRADREARSDDASTWLSRAEAATFAEQLPKPLRLGGIGLELGDLGDGRALGGIDLDSCRDEAGCFAQWALDIIALLQSYSELSPSGTGAKVFFVYDAASLAELRAGTGINHGKSWKRGSGEHAPGIELYLSSRYFAVTDDWLPNTPPDLRMVSVDTLRRLILEIGPAYASGQDNNGPGATRKTVCGSQDNDGLAERISRKAAWHPSLARRWGSDWSGLSDPSRSGRAMALGTALKRAGFSFDEMRAALLLNTDTAEWVRDKGDATGGRELHRIWKKADSEAPGNGDGGHGNQGESQSASDDEPRPPEFADEALALRYADTYSNRLRYVASWGRWLVYIGGVWRFDETKRALDLSRSICRRTSVECDNPKTANALASAKTATAVERLAMADRRLAATVEQWDRDLWLLNTPSSVVDLRTGLSRLSRHEDYMTKITAVAPAPGCPLWLAFLDRVTSGDMELQAFLQRTAGYSLTGSTQEHAMFFAYGIGGNGKGVFLNALTGILGSYAAIAPMETFTASQSERHPTDLAMLQGARLVTAQETEEGRRWAESRIKAMTGGDPVSARFMRQDFFTYTPAFKLFIAGNHKPGLRNVDQAIRRRLHLIPFDAKISESERDPDLPVKLRAEWPGILQWMIDGCLAWQRVGLAPPAAVRKATDDYLAAEDAQALWVAECCVTGTAYYDTSANLYASWKRWAENAGEAAGSQKQFSQGMEKRGTEPRRQAGTGRAGFDGVAVKPKLGTNELDQKVV